MLFVKVATPSVPALFPKSTNNYNFVTTQKTQALACVFFLSKFLDTYTNNMVFSYIKKVIAHKFNYGEDKCN